MRILSVSPYYEPEGGGLERYAHATLARLAASGHDVRALAFTRHGTGTAQRDGVTVERSRPWLRLGTAPVDPRFVSRVRRAIRRHATDVVVAHTPVPFPAEMAYLAARREGVPFVVTYHAGRLRGSTPLLQVFARLDRATLERRMLDGSRRLIAVGPYVRDHALARHRDRVAIIPPGVDTARFRPGGTATPHEILFVGPLSRSYRWKGVDVLWEAYRRVRREDPDAVLTLVGDGDRRAALARTAQRDRLRVNLPGRLDETALVAAYRRAAVVVLPSITDAESFGMVLAEANACGRPVIGADIGGIPDFVRHGENGLLAPPGDPGAIAARILQLLHDPTAARRLGDAGRERVLREHDWRRLAARTEAVLEHAVAGSPEAVSGGPSAREPSRPRHVRQPAVTGG